MLFLMKNKYKISNISFIFSLYNIYIIQFFFFCLYNNYIILSFNNFFFLFKYKKFNYHNFIFICEQFYNNYKLNFFIDIFSRQLYIF
jgi:hypothetical protein